MTVLEPGPGMGFFTIPLAKLVGPSGRVIVVDVQAKMIATLKTRAARAGLLDRIDARVVSAASMALDDLCRKIDFALAFAMLHEFPDAPRFFAEVAQALRSEGKVLLAEPRGHVKPAMFDSQLRAAESAGFAVAARPQIPRSHAALLTRSAK